MAGESEDAGFGALEVLNDPVRRRLYRIVASSPEEVGRDGAAEAAGISRSLAAFHLDRLVEAGLLEASFRRTSGRSGPGAGRPAKLYRRAPGEHAVSVPPRSYGAASRLLAEVVDRAGLDRELAALAREAGARQAADGGGPDPDPVGLLRGLGYQPFGDEGTVRLHNCPFHALAEQFPALICGMNLALVEGLLGGRAAPADGAGWTAVMEPRPGTCCVALKSKNKTD